jgi:epoxide hydrolase
VPIVPYTLDIADAQLDDLHERLRRTRWPSSTESAEDDAGWDRGVPHSYARKLADYWLHTFEWRKQEAWLNRYPQFMADVDGQSIHFFHVKSREPNALPLMLLHGWPSSSVEFVGLIDRLTDPVAHGGSAADAFHVVLPTTPGFGLSSPLVGHWHAMRTADAYCRLMHELGYENWGVHGGDIGADIAGEINHIEPKLVGVHVSSDMPAIVWFARFTGGDPAANPTFSDAERQEVEGLLRKASEDGGYLEIQKTRPLTIGYLLNDSPVGQLTWITEKFKLWTDVGGKLPEETVNLDQLLTNISLYWFTMSGATAADFLSSNLHVQRDWGRPSYAPMGMAVFSARSGARALHDPEHRLPHWSDFSSGGHFPAMEVPDLLVGDLRTFFRERRGV